MEYFLFDFIVTKKHHYCIAYVNDKDGFIVKENLLKIFLTTKDAVTYCKEYHIFLQDEDVSVCNVDKVLESKNNSSVFMIDCNTILWFWNTIQDVAYSINETFYGDENGEKQEILYVYNQLFYGTNPKVMRGDEEIYVPKWDEQDIEIINKVVKDGLRILEKALQIKIL